MRAQFGLVHLHQPHLPHGGGGLQLMQLFGTRLPTQAFHAFGHGATGDHDELTTHAIGALHQSSQLAGPLLNGGLIQPPTFIGHQAGAHLDHNTSRVLYHRHDFKLFRPQTLM